MMLIDSVPAKFAIQLLKGAGSYQFIHYETIIIIILDRDIVCTVSDVELCLVWIESWVSWKYIHFVHVCREVYSCWYFSVLWSKCQFHIFVETVNVFIRCECEHSNFELNILKNLIFIYIKYTVTFMHY